MILISRDFYDFTKGGLRYIVLISEKNMADFPKREVFVKFCKPFACFVLKHGTKSSSYPSSKFWTF